MTPTTFVPLGLSDQQKSFLLDKNQFNLKLTERGSKEKLIAVFAGTISEQFDLVNLLERNEVLIQSLDKIILVGNVSKGEFYSNLDKWLNEKGIRYEDFGELSKAEYVKVLNSADVALFNMKMSGMPKKVWDYSLCGLPIIIPKEKSIDLNITGIASIEIEDFTPDLYKEALKSMDYESYKRLFQSNNMQQLITSLV
jgi:glycosyltransferase involved in cell wall biosynthesis